MKTDRSIKSWNCALLETLMLKEHCIPLIDMPNNPYLDKYSKEQFETTKIREIARKFVLWCWS